MLSLVFNRSMLLSGRLVGIILLVIIGLVSCSSQQKQPPDATTPSPVPSKDSAQDQQNKTGVETRKTRETRETSKSAPDSDITSIQLEGDFQFHLPDDFITLFSDHNNTPKLLKELLQFPDCNDFNYNGQEKFFTATCSYFMNQSQRSSFKQKTNDNHDASAFPITEENLSPKISAAVETQPYQPYTLCCDQNCQQIQRNKQIVSFPYQCLNSDLYAYVSPLSHCQNNEIEKTKRPLQNVILSSSKEFQPNFPSCEVQLKLPTFLQNTKVSLDTCKYDDDSKNQRLLHCRLSESDIKQAAEAEQEEPKEFNKEFQLFLGTGWEPATVSLNIIQDKHNPTNDQILNISRPSWPFASNDTWWQGKNDSSPVGDDLCITPKYEMDRVTYKSDANQNHKITLEKELLSKLELQDGQLPTLKDIGWEQNWPLPDSVTLKIKQLGITTSSKYNDQPKYLVETDILAWKLSDFPRSLWKLSKRYEKKLENIVSMNVSLTHSLGLVPGKDYAVYQFPDKISCREFTGIETIAKLQSGTTQIKIKPCLEYVKLRDDLEGEPVSRCTQASGKTLTFQPYKCNGKRKLIIVALGSKLDLYQKQIKDAIANIFQANIIDRKALTLVTIGKTRDVSKLFQCEDFNDMSKKEATEFIYKTKKLESILRFGVTNLRTLGDLKTVHVTYKSELSELDSIFYLTDGNNMPTNMDKIRELAITPKDFWYKDNGIKLTVLTMGQCTVWTKQAQAKCHVLKKAGTIERALKQFIGGTS